MKFKRANLENRMGLDQYAYVAAQNGEWDKYWADNDTSLSKPREIAYWRKHPNLQGWMERLWYNKINVPIYEGNRFEQNNYPYHSFNGVELELTWEDLNALEQDIRNGKMSKLDTKGFFFGNPSDDYYRQQDLQFIADAKAELILGLKVFYNSSW